MSRDDGKKERKGAREKRKLTKRNDHPMAMVYQRSLY